MKRLSVMAAAFVLAAGLVLAGCGDGAGGGGGGGNVTLRGTPRVGETLTVTFSGFGNEVEIYWQRASSPNGNDKVFIELDVSTYTITEDDLDKYIWVDVRNATKEESSNVIGPILSKDSGSSGATWTASGDTTFGTSYINGIAYGGGRFVAVGGDYTSGSKAAYSTDGVTWTAVANTTFGGHPIQGIAWGGNTFVAMSAAKAAYSADGVTWTDIANTTFDSDAINGIAYGGGRFVAVGGYNKSALTSQA